MYGVIKCFLNLKWQNYSAIYCTKQQYFNNNCVLVNKGVYKTLLHFYNGTTD